MPEIKVEHYIQEYAVRMVRKEKMEAEDVLFFLEECRKIFRADIFCICEAVLTGYGFEIPYLTYSKEEYNYTGYRVDMSGEKLELFCSKFDEDGFCTEKLGIFPNASEYRCLNYGIANGDKMDGCVVAVSYDRTRVWTRNEREAMKKIGRLLRIVVQNSLLAKVDVKEYNEVLKALSAEYTSVYTVDLERGRMYLFQTSISGNDLLDKVNEGSRYDDMMRTYLENAIYPEDREEFVKNINFAIVRKKLMENNVYDVDYRRVLFGKVEHAQMRFLRVAGTKEKVIVAVRCVDDIVRREQRRLKVIHGLSQEYSSIFLVDLEHDEVHPYRISEIVSGIALKNVESLRLDAMQKHLNKIVHKEDRGQLIWTMDIENIREELTKNRVHYTRYRCVIEGKEDHYLQQIINISKGTDEITQLIYAYKNIEKEYQEEIQQKKQLEELVTRANAASESKSAFLFNMSHDIRTPMNAIIGFTNIAQEHINNPEILENALNKISASGEILLKLVNDVLDLARIESGKVNAEMTPRNIVQDTLEIYTMFEDEMQEAGIDFSIETHVRKPYVIADFLHMSQICINLLSNAKKFTKPGGQVQMQITQLDEVKNGFAKYELKIADNGIGMGKEFQKKLFGEFERERTATQSGIQGTGLGLAIVNRLVDLLGGELEFRSERGLGSEFCVTFQLQVTDKAALIKKKDRQEVKVDFSNVRALLAEDNEINTEIAVMILEDMGITVENASDGAEAVHMLEKEGEGYYDVIFMDVQMPVLDGYQATRIIRGMENKKLAQIPIIAMTANAFEDDCQKSLSVGMNAHIAKPIKGNIIKKTLSEVLCKE